MSLCADEHSCSKEEDGVSILQPPTPHCTKTAPLAKGPQGPRPQIECGTLQDPGAPPEGPEPTSDSCPRPELLTRPSSAQPRSPVLGPPTLLGPPIAHTLPQATPISLRTCHHRHSRHPGTPISRSHDAPEQPPTPRAQGHPTPIHSSPFTLMGGHVSSHDPTSLQPSHAPWPHLCTHYVALKGALTHPRLNSFPCVFFPHLHMHRPAAAPSSTHTSLSKQL